MSEEALGKFLEKARNDRGLSIYRLAKLSGVSHSYISQLEKGDKEQPSLDILQKLAGPLDISLSELLITTGLIKEYELKQALEEFTDYDSELDKLIYKTLKTIMGGISESNDWDFKEKLLQELRYFLQEFGIEIDNARMEFRRLKKEKANQTIELIEVIEKQNITYNGHPLDEVDRKKIKGMLEVMFSDKK